MFDSDSHRKRVLVLDVDERASLAVVRSLARAGLRVTVAGNRRWSLAGASRGVEGIQLRSHPLREPAAYVHEVAHLATSIGSKLVLPVTDASVEALLQFRQLFPDDVVMPFALSAVYRAATDKVRVHRLGIELGIGIEETAVVERADDPGLGDSRLYPCVIMPHRSLIGSDVHVRIGVSFASDRDECERVLRALPSEAFPVLVQRRIRGSGEGVFLARWGGGTIARFAHPREASGRRS